MRTFTADVMTQVLAPEQAALVMASHPCTTGEDPLVPIRALRLGDFGARVPLAPFTLLPCLQTPAPLSLWRA
jgi:hypothetical protein